MEDLKIICCQPASRYFIWQVHMWIESLRKIDLSQNAVVLLYLQKDELLDGRWDDLADLYPEAEFFAYIDDEDVSSNFSLYIPISRVFLLKKYWEEFPEMQQKKVFYCDSDVIFTEHFNISHLLKDDICYLSDTNSYINIEYFRSKKNDVIESKKENFDIESILSTLFSVIGIEKEDFENIKNHSGGAQYLLKNIPTSFWKKMYNDTLYIKKYFADINSEWFESENKGIQSWCADMWGLLFTLLYYKKKIKVVEELDFIWCNNSIEEFDKKGIYHNAGVVSNEEQLSNGETLNYFDKGKYRDSDPTEDIEFITKMLNNKNSHKMANFYYLILLLELKTKYNFNY